MRVGKREECRARLHDVRPPSTYPPASCASSCAAPRLGGGAHKAHTNLPLTYILCNAPPPMLYPHINPPTRIRILGSHHASTYIRHRVGPAKDDVAHWIMSLDDDPPPPQRLRHTAARAWQGSSDKQAPGRTTRARGNPDKHRWRPLRFLAVTVPVRQWHHCRYPKPQPQQLPHARVAQLM